MTCEYFKQISIGRLEPNTEIKIVTSYTIQQLTKAFTAEDRGQEVFYKKVSSFTAKLVAIDRNKGISIQLALNLIDRCHLVSEYISPDDIRSMKIGYDGNIYIVVKKRRYDSFYKKYSVSFALVDFIGSKNKLKESPLSVVALQPKILAIIDSFAVNHPELAIVSFADTIIIKTIWSYLKHKTYSPETFLKSVLDLRSLLRKRLHIKSYVIVTQGQNFIETDKLIHLNSTGNHIGMLSLGPPFAALFEIERTIRNNKENSDIYLEDTFYYSMNNRSFLTRLIPKSSFPCPISGNPINYLAIDVDQTKTAPFLP